MKLRFIISRYEDGTFEIETKHIHYAFRDDLNFDDITAENVPSIMYQITETLKKENIEAYFIIL